MATRKRPHDPAKAALAAMASKRADFEAVNLAPGAADLARNADVEITRAGQKRDDQKVREDSARRLDAFEALRPSMRAERYAGCYDAARRYEHQLLVRRGENDRGPSVERVDRTAGLTTDAMIDAAIWIEAINARLAPRDWWLLMELIAPSRNLDGYEKVWKDDKGEVRRTGPFYGWRATVAYITDETHDHSQGAVVRAMTVNLRDAILALEQARLEAAKKAA